MHEKETQIITYNDKKGLTSEETKELIERSLDMDKADDIICIPLSDNSALADYMIIASGTSSRHINALAKKLKERLHLEGVKHIATEGLEQCDWVVLDTGDVIVHLFRPEVRAFYSIEKMWGAHASFDIVSNQIQA